MASKKKSATRSKTRRPARPPVVFDTEKFENVHQIGGIQTALLESPAGSGQFRRIAMFNTGSPLRFTVAVDRGGDIVDAFHGPHSLTYLTMAGIKAPSHAYHRELDWLYGWAGGLVTSCGPQYAGMPREEDGQQLGLHGRHSSQPAAIEMLINPDPHRGRHEMLLTMTVRDTRMFGPNLEVRRTITCTLGIPQIRLFDEVTNRGNQQSPHTWLYHVNYGYPLLDQGTRLIYRGKLDTSWNMSTPTPSAAQIDRIKRVSPPLDEHDGSGERGVIFEPAADRNGDAHIGLINQRLGLGVEMVFPAEQLPRVANWQHFGAGGSFVTGIEPFSGSLMGKDRDPHPKAVQQLRPGQTKRYQLTINVLDNAAALRSFATRDGKVT